MAAIIFDFDGTIADSFDYSVTFLAKEAGKHPLNAEQKASFHGLSFFRIARLLGISWFKLPTLLHKGRKRMTLVVKDIEPFQGMPEVIRKLYADKHTLYVVSTNTSKNIHKFLRRHQLDSYFSEVYGGVGMFGKAPALRRIMREQHIETRKGIYIGDELRDVLASQSIGLRVIAVTWGFAKISDLKAKRPAGLAHSPEDILDIVGG